MQHLIKTGLMSLVLSLSLAPPVAAGPLEDGQAAFDRHDCATARQLWRPLADQGNTSAQFKLATTYEFGGDFGCGPQNYAEAAEWYQKAADQGNADAQSSLGDMYANAQVGGPLRLGVLQDYAEAVKWYRKAADQGHAYAQFSLGELYRNGHGVLQDYTEAVKWYRSAAEQGNNYAQFSLGFMYDNGQGVSQDYVEAHKWYNLAAVRFTASERANRELALKSRDQLAAKMTPAQIAEAQKLAREWKPK